METGKANSERADWKREVLFDAKRTELERAVVEAAKEWYAEQLEQHEDCSASCLAGFETVPVFTAARALIEFESENKV